MTVGIVGLGLIGGSFAKAYQSSRHTVYAYDTDDKILNFALINGDVNEKLTDGNMKDCDIILVCIYPEAAAEFIETKGRFFGSRPIVIDSCGTKRLVVERGMKAAKKYGFTYAGGHPMAGTQFSGYKHSKKDMFKGAPMVIVPPEYDDIVLLDRIKKLLKPVGFAGITVTTAEKHDEMIAFTSQLAHIVSGAYIKSPSATSHKGLSAGSYKDMTRVAWLNPEMWTELFLENKENLSKELDILIKNLTDYKEAIDKSDREKLKALLEEGKRKKEEVDG